ncbi:MAG: RNA polymerase sigma factor [Terriglobales bacterium]
MAVAFEHSTPQPAAGVEALFLAHHERVLRAAYRITGRMSDAEDVAQSVFMHLIQNGGAASIGNAESYLYRAAINAGLDLLRRRAHECATPLDEAASLANKAADSSPERACSSAELRQWLRRALAGLGPRSAEVFVLRYLEERELRDIAQMLGTSRAVVAVMLHRARACLRSDFRRFMGDE